MPNSKLDVATTARSRPDFRSSSISARCSLDTEPWCAFANTFPAPDTEPACAIISAGSLAGVVGRGGVVGVGTLRDSLLGDRVLVRHPVSEVAPSCVSSRSCVAEASSSAASSRRSA